MKRLIIYSIISGFILFVVSCYYDNEEALYPTLSTSCDTTSVTYSVTIVSMLKDNCYSCHSNATAPAYGNNIAFQNYTDVKNNSAHIRASINMEPGHSPMPKNGGKLNNCLLKQFDIWIAAGTPDN